MSKVQSLTLRAPPPRTDATALQRLRGMLAAWQRRTQDRELLRQMGERQRRDLGIDSETWGRESAEPFWRA